MDDKNKKIAEYNIEKCLDQVFTSEKIRELLHVFSVFHMYDYRNQLLIWKQNKDAKCVVGAEAVKANGIPVPDDAKRMILLYPVVSLSKEGEPVLVDGEPAYDRKTEAPIYEIEPEYSSDYKVVSAYDMTDAMYEPPRIDFSEIIKNIREITSFSITEAPESDFLSVGSNLSYIDLEAHTINLKPNLKDDDFNRECIRRYIDYEFKEYEASDYYTILQHFVEYVVLDYVGLLPKSFSVVGVVKIAKEDVTTKRRFLDELSTKSAVILEDLTVPILSVTETAIANSLLVTDDISDMATTMFFATKTIKDEALIDAINSFVDKMHFVEDGYLRGLCEAVRNRELYSYPPYPLIYCPPPVFN